MIDSYQKFKDELAKHESLGKGDYKAVNGSYLGRYQMGPDALIDAGYMDKDRNWTVRNNIRSKDDFLNAPAAQEDAIERYHKKLWSYIQATELDQYVGRTVGGIQITSFGLLAGAHLKGIGKKEADKNGEQGLRQFLESNGDIDPFDGNGTGVSKYIRAMAGDDPNFFPAAKQKPAPQKQRPILQRGHKGEHVTELQTMLNQTGSTLKVDGLFGAQTHDAVLDFQKRYSLTQDGKVGPETWQKLDDEISKLRKANMAPAIADAYAQYLLDNTPSNNIPLRPRDSENRGPSIS